MHDSNHMTLRNSLEHAATNCAIAIAFCIGGKSDIPLTIQAFVLHGIAVDLFEYIATISIDDPARNPKTLYGTLIIGSLIINAIAIAAFARLNIIGWPGIGVCTAFTVATVLHNINRWRSSALMNPAKAHPF